MNPPDTFFIRHLLATLAYRLQKLLEGAQTDFASFELGFGVRTPQQLVRHMNGVLHYGLKVSQTGDAAYRGSLQDLNWEGEIARFHETLVLLEAEMSKPQDASFLARLLQGPLSDTMTHIGQLALLRRAAGSPVRAENFFRARVRIGQVGANQPDPADPDA